MKLLSTLYGQNAELLIVTASGTYSCHWDLNGNSDGRKDMQNCNEMALCKAVT
jgi:hypothetical protein